MFVLTVVDEIANLKKEAQELKAIKEAIGTPNFSSLVFEKVFNNDIRRLLSMSDMWKSRKPPQPLSYKSFVIPSDEQCLKIANDDQKIWDLAESIAVFKHRYVHGCFMGPGVDGSLDRLSRRWRGIQRDDAVQVLSFDKDDMDTLDFVAATSNIRSTIFSIPPKSKFDIKRPSPPWIVADDRNGGEYNSRNSDYKCHRSRIMCPPSAPRPAKPSQ